MKEYFSHDYNARSDKKMVVVFMRHGLAGIGAYWCIIEMLYEEGGYLLLNEYERISFELRIDENVIRDIIERTKLFKNDSEKIIDELLLDNKIPVIVGGSGLYVNSLIYDLDFGNAKSDTKLREYYT